MGERGAAGEGFVADRDEAGGEGDGDEGGPLAEGAACDGGALRHSDVPLRVDRKPHRPKVDGPHCCLRLFVEGAQSKKAQLPIERPSGSGSVMEAREEQPEKARLPMEVRPVGKVTRAREEQPRKAPVPMEVRPAGRVMEVREEQPSKALLLMETRPAGRAAETREEQLAKAASPIEARPAGKVTEVRAEQLWKA